ncbi:MAG: hypothetical protein AB8F94_19885 [Saprospiraceae bacterium]
MGHILKNKNLEIHIDLPLENYHFSRFDWTGKIVSVKFQNVQISGIEITDSENENFIGKGFYNEFGFNTPLGFNDIKVGDWFHKIGVGLLKKEDDQYLFNKNYQIQPANFKVFTEQNRVLIICESKALNGYSYLLKKEIEVHENSFIINYDLKNTGEKEIITDEYVHSFIAVNNDSIGSNYSLKFPFQLMPHLFEETVNPEQKVDIEKNEIKFNSSPKEQFFFSYLSGRNAVDAAWELINLKNKVGISETGNFQTKKVNLWGWKHVISPELFFNIFISPNQSVQWSRTFQVYKTK